MKAASDQLIGLAEEATQGFVRVVHDDQLLAAGYRSAALVAHRVLDAELLHPELGKERTNVGVGIDGQHDLALGLAHHGRDGFVL